MIKSAWNIYSYALLIIEFTLQDLQIHKKYNYEKVLLDFFDAH